MKIFKFLGFVLLPALIIACGQPPQSGSSSPNQTASPDQSKALLNEISGVWKSSDNTMWTIVVDGGQLQFLLDDKPILAKIGDIDTENQTVNLLIQRSDTGQEAIWTIRKINSKNESDGFTLNVIDHDGETYDLGFVRKIGVDDKNRIHNIFLQAEQQQREALKQEQEAQEQARLEEEQQAQEQATETIPVEESSESENTSIQDTETTE